MRLVGRPLSLAGFALVLALAACDSGGADAPPHDTGPEEPGPQEPNPEEPGPEEPGPQEPGPQEPDEVCYADTEIAGSAASFGPPSTSAGCYPAGVLNALAGIGQAFVRVEALPDAPSCGTCLELTGPAGTRVVRMIDDCSTCALAAEFEVDDETFHAVAGTASGLVEVAARTVPCPVDGGLRFFAGDATNAWFVQLYVTDHRHPIEQVELRVSGEYVPMVRRSYGAWEWMSSGQTAEPPYAVRVTDAFGHVVETTVAVDPGSAVTVSEQLPACS